MIYQFMAIVRAFVEKNFGHSKPTWQTFVFEGALIIAMAPATYFMLYAFRFQMSPF